MAWASAFCLLATGPALAEAHLTRAEAAARMESLDLALAEGPAVLDPAMPPSVLEEGRVETGDLQAALMQLAILSGANDQLPIVQAQKGQALYLRRGRMSLAQVAARLEEMGQEGLVQRDGAYLLTRPLIVWSDAALAVDPDEILRMDRAAGALLISFGDLSVRGGQIAGIGDAPVESPDFAPFVLVAGQAGLWAEGAVFSDLGAEKGGLFGGVSVLKQGVAADASPVVLRDSLFQSVGQVAVYAAKGARIEGNQIEGNLLLEGGQDLRVLANDITPGLLGAGLRLTGGASAVRVEGNLVQGGAATGIMADRGVRDLILQGNLVRNNAGDGISLSRGSCARVIGNLLEKNGAVGLRLRAETAAEVRGNALLDNGTAAIELAGQTHDNSLTLVEANQIAGNREGLRGAGIGLVRLVSNQTAGQLPRLFSGEFAIHLGDFLTSSQQNGAEVFLISAPAGQSEKAASPCKKGEM